MVHVYINIDIMGINEINYIVAVYNIDIMGYMKSTR